MFFVCSNGTTAICNVTQKFYYNGLYGLNTSSCQIETLKSPDNAYLPILYAFLILMGLQVVWSICNLKPGKGS